ncbi:DUF6958 family protein [Rheinheimera salexigens]|uniref:Restriction system protein Mrr-like N-terminal domain-containing protein n=1 Tax=Rheinheimera salexigens TaxID=1628148 RepID=A0A1E7Q304_9GAMM|nr:hypothetical protein [Rheinheimera salexigens]OEY68516.1 hypothetical protein BI198_02230 [Rheinheimera salexigens]
MGLKAHQIAVENINIPGKSSNVDATKYLAMKKAMLEILSATRPGLTQKEILQQVKAHLPESVFPQGATSGWWAKTVQLDLEAKGVVKRETCKPLRWHKA